MIEVNLVALDEENRIMSSYVLEGIQQQDYERFYYGETNKISYENRYSYVATLYRIMLMRVPASEKYDVRTKEAIVQRALNEDDFMSAVVKWKTQLRFYPRDVMAEYKFMSECQTISNLLTFFDDNKDYTFSLIFVKPYE